MARIDLMDPLHPSVAESLNMLREAFKERYLPAQRLLEDPQSAADLLR